MVDFEDAEQRFVLGVNVILLFDVVVVSRADVHLPTVGVCECVRVVYVYVYVCASSRCVFMTYECMHARAQITSRTQKLITFIYIYIYIYIQDWERSKLGVSDTKPEYSVFIYPINNPPKPPDIYIYIPRHIHTYIPEFLWHFLDQILQSFCVLLRLHKVCLAYALVDLHV